LCDANFYCRTSTSKDICPLHTTSSAGSFSRVNCLCDPGFQCTYYKQIQAIVTLNATLWEFNNDIGGVRTAFINAMAAAAGVHPNYVTINDVMTQGRRRRHLLALEPEPRETIDVHASITGAVKLRDLDKHLNRHSDGLHIAHRWEQAPQIMAVAVRPTGRRDIPAVLQAPIAKPPPNLSASEAAKNVVREKIKARSIKLVNKDFAENMFAKF
jgi:hypothetical protein